MHCHNIQFDRTAKLDIYCVSLSSEKLWWVIFKIINQREHHLIKKLLSRLIKNNTAAECLILKTQKSL